MKMAMVEDFCIFAKHSADLNLRLIAFLQWD